MASDMTGLVVIEGRERFMRTHVLGDEEERGGLRLRSVASGSQIVSLDPSSRSSSDLLSLGLAPGDVITSVDGKDTSGSLSVAVLHSMASGPGAEAKVEGFRMASSFPRPTQVPFSIALPRRSLRDIMGPGFTPRSPLPGPPSSSPQGTPTSTQRSLQRSLVSPVASRRGDKQNVGMEREYEELMAGRAGHRDALEVGVVARAIVDQMVEAERWLASGGDGHFEDFLGSRMPGDLGGAATRILNDARLAGNKLRNTIKQTVVRRGVDAEVLQNMQTQESSLRALLEDAAQRADNAAERIKSKSTGEAVEKISLFAARVRRDKTVERGHAIADLLKRLKEEMAHASLAKEAEVLQAIQAREDEFKGELSKMRFLLEQTRSGHAADLAAAKHAFEADVQRVEIMTRQECEKKAADEREAIEIALRAKELELIQVKGARDLLSQRVGLVEAELDEALGGKERAIELGVGDRFAVAELRRTMEAISGMDESKKNELTLKEKVISDLQTDLDAANDTVVILKDKLTRLKALWKRLSEEMVSTIDRLTSEVAHNNAEREEERNRYARRTEADNQSWDRIHAVLKQGDEKVRAAVLAQITTIHRRLGKAKVLAKSTSMMTASDKEELMSDLEEQTGVANAFKAIMEGSKDKEVIEQKLRRKAMQVTLDIEKLRQAVSVERSSKVSDWSKTKADDLKKIIAALQLDDDDTLTTDR